MTGCDILEDVELLEKKREYQKKYHQENKERLKESKKVNSMRYQKRNRERLREYSRKYYQAHREKILERNRKRYIKKHKEVQYMSCDGDCFNCKYDDCILTDKELIRQMRKPKSIGTPYKPHKHRIHDVKGEFKSEYILTPLPGSPESQRTWEVNEKNES